MNIQLSVFRYLEHIFRDTSVGVKALLLDPETLAYISVAMSKTELYTHEVVLIEQLSQRVRKPADPQVAALSCYCLLRPTNDNIDLLCEELQNPHFSKYALFFTNTITDSQLHQLASRDTNTLIENFQEVFVDFSALGTRLFSLNMPDISEFRKNPQLSEQSSRIAEGLFAAICSVRGKPIIRYDKNSEVTKTIATGLSQLVSSNGDLFNNSRDDSVVVLILDRRNDPVTPLLHFFYYLPIIHDLFTIKNNIIEIGRKQFIIDERSDPETERIDTMYLEDAGNAIRQRFDGIKAINEQVKSEKIATMNEKALKVLQGNNEITYANTHLELYQALHQKVIQDGLLDITSLEQIIATVNDAGDQCQQFCDLIQSPSCSKENALRLALVYVLHYEKSDPDYISRVLGALESRGPWHQQEMRYAQVLTRIAGQDLRSGDIFSNRSLMAKFKKGLKSSTAKSQFEMYHPPLETILQAIKDKKLDPNQYPFIDNKRGDSYKVIVFCVGGATYAELGVVTNMSKKRTESGIGHQFILGGTTVHNAASFLDFEVKPFTS
ncbi:Vacuolar protein sorting-associated protein 45 [Tritrichomonas foetus]|uniref:Vacuolar protein sorting-associated protein 45 n=1 Tax=Tritrichomonas foetus TaxID=1144522 RepID=A0A1J4KW41_9EUKA|nr:Vacuolar protein sorting-associated protein 45 [Tritrichomonas foetus]|eukprot:OHT13972.1 Vacuolar protein sorting-associated protein 45 [Tritrichomonas foetus]